MAKIKIRPLDDRIVVQPVDAESTTAGGIVLPDSAREKATARYRAGCWSWQAAG